MKIAAILVTLVLPLAGASLQDKLEKSIKGKLGKPYVFGSTGQKTYDCSGFVWAAYRDAGLLFKRTTARKMYFDFPAAKGKAQGQLGALVFFNDLEHVGIVRSKDEFYHASSSHGTMKDTFAPYWMPHVYGYRIVKP